ncbi:hypothetical protein ASD01_21595 [Ensifer sp. Root423]|nr:hypothetical protein ASD01_21595 [Ensifer sp. Root423]
MPLWRTNLKRVLVTGGAGFIGGHLVKRLLLDGYEVVVLDDLSTGQLSKVPNQATFLQGSVLDRELVDATIENVDACIHLAAIASVLRCNGELVSSHEVNATGFLRVVEAISRINRDVPLLYASSAAVYGANESSPLHEELKTDPISPYGVDKMSCELHARAAYEVYGISTFGFRFFNVYGPGQDSSSPYSGVITKFAEKIKRGEKLSIFGDGEQTRDFVFVGDIVDCLVAALRQGTTGAKVLNVCTGEKVSINELARIITEIFETDPNVEHTAAMVGEVRHSVGDPSRLMAQLGCGATTSLREGLRSFLT